MTIRWIPITIAIAALAGCATVEDFRADPPDAVVNLKLPPEQAALCMTRNIERISSGLLIDRRPGITRGMEMIVRVHEGTLFAVMDIDPENSGSRATIRLASVMFTTKKMLIERISEGC